MFPRKRFETMARIRPLDQQDWQVGALFDLGEGGCALSLSHPLAEGTRVEICLGPILAERPLLHARGEVVHSRSEGRHYVMGLVFQQETASTADLPAQLADA